MVTAGSPTKTQVDIAFNPKIRYYSPNHKEDEQFSYNYVYIYNDQLFDILLSHEKLSSYDTVDTIESQYLRELEDSGSCDSAEFEEIQKMCGRAEIVEKEIEVKVLMTCQSIMQKLAPNIKSTSLPASLQAYMYPSIIKLQIVTLNGAIHVVRNDSLPDQDFHPPALDSEVFDVGVPYYQASAIEYLAELNTSVFKVSVKGQILCAKVTRISVHDSILSEFKTLDKVRRANFDSAVKVPCLRGIITSHTGVRSIEAGGENGTGTGVDDNKSSDKPVYIITVVQKQKWARQIEHSLNSLHSRDIIWCDAKTSNVLIDDETEDAWVVDFGGGFTEGWVDHELRGTVDGDLQALGKIKVELEKD